MKDYEQYLGKQTNKKQPKPKPKKKFFFSSSSKTSKTSFKGDMN